MAMPGSIGIGLVWGWLLGGRRGSAVAVCVLVAATAILAAEAALLTAPDAAAALVGAALASGLVRVAWRRQLRLRSGARAHARQRGGRQ